MKSNEERVQRIMEKAEIKRQKRSKILRTSAIICCLATFVLAINLVLFVPYTADNYNIASYKGSEYFKLMDSIGKLTYSPYKTNNFNKWELFKFEGCGKAMEAPGMDMGSSSDPANDLASYEEVTNNQVDGIIEGDLFKRSSKNVFYISQKYDKYPYIELNVYDLDDLSLEASLDIEVENRDSQILAYEMYLSSDTDTVYILIEERYLTRNIVYTYYTNIVKVDVSDPSSPKETERRAVSGFYVSSRMIDDELYVVTDFMVYKPDFDDTAQFLPHIDRGDDMQTLPMDDIILPEDAQSAEYSIITCFDKELLLVDSIALFSYSDILYVSGEHIFVTRDVNKIIEVDGENASYEYSVECTEVACLSFKDELEFIGTFTAEGTIVNQYSMDEFESKLRLFTTSNYKKISYSGSGSFPLDEGAKCNFYCFDLDTMELIASVENFAEKDESVKSVRFERNTAYVCTAFEQYDQKYDIHYIIDPVFEFDLSDLKNITYKDTGTIPGYSLSLIKFGDYLLGIGYGDDYDTLKIELYRSEEENVVSVTNFCFYDSYFSKEFKAYFIDAEHNLVGLGVEHNGIDEFILLKFNGTKFERLAKCDLMGSKDTVRACFDSGRVLVFNVDFAKIINI